MCLYKDIYIQAQVFFGDQFFLDLYVLGLKVEAGGPAGHLVTPSWVLGGSLRERSARREPSCERSEQGPGPKTIQDTEKKHT